MQTTGELSLPVAVHFRNQSPPRPHQTRVLRKGWSARLEVDHAKCLRNKQWWTVTVKVEVTREEEEDIGSDSSSAEEFKPAKVRGRARKGGATPGSGRKGETLHPSKSSLLWADSALWTSWLLSSKLWLLHQSLFGRVQYLQLDLSWNKNKQLQASIDIESIPCTATMEN